MNFFQREKDLNRFEDKYRVKTADETHPLGLASLLVFVLHALSFVSAATMLLFYEGHIVERILVTMLWLCILLGIERFKSKFSNDTFTFRYASQDETKTEMERRTADKQADVAFRLLVVFWSLSLAATIVSTIYVASKKVYIPIAYNLDLQERLEVAKTSLKTFTGRVKLAEQKTNQNAYDVAFKNWTKHKDEVDSANNNNQWTYGTIGFLIAILIDTGIYFSRKWYEKMQYEVYVSLRKKDLPRQQGGETRQLPIPQQTQPFRRAN